MNTAKATFLTCESRPHFVSNIKFTIGIKYAAQTAPMIT